MPNLIVNIVGDTTGLSRAFTSAQRQATTFTTRSQRMGRTLRRSGMFAGSAASALGLQNQVDDVAQNIVGHFGVGGDAQNAVGTLATSMTDLGLESKGAAKLIGKAGLAGAVGFASYEMTTMALKATGLDRKLDALGGSAYNAAAKLGLVNDPMAQFEGKPILAQKASTFLRNRAARLEAGGMTAQQAADRLMATHPGLAKRDVEVLAGVYGKKPIVVENHVHIDGAQVAASVNRHNARNGSHTAQQTSGARR